MKYGFVKVAAAVPAVKVADVDYNVQQIESIIAQAEGRGVEVIVFPELCITGYTCQDLFKEQLLLDRAEGAVITLLDFTRKLDIISIIGLPVIINGLLYNCAAVIQSGQLLGIIPKTYLPNYARETLVCLCPGSESYGLLLCRQQSHRECRAQTLRHQQWCEVRCGDLRGCVGTDST